MEAVPARDWADGLGTDALLGILHRLDHVDVLTAADHVCRSWRRAAREEPALLNRGAGRCEAFCGEYAGDDGFLVYLSEHLRLISCNGVTNEGVAEAAKGLPLLDELELSLCDNVGGSEVFEVVGEVCPQLKQFRLNKKRFDVTVWVKENYVQGIATMHGLRTLQLFSNILTNTGLETILDNCPHLESLDIRHCFNVDMDETLLLKCARIKTLRLPDDPTDDYDLEVQSPIRTYVPREEYYMCYSDCCYNRYEDSEDSGDDSDFYGEPSRYESDLDKYEKMLPLSMRTFLR
ncbi:hypothetical protein GQ55_6G060700 [Panicum hallii var. hallii]|uniref:F-box domain-containing protein n=1 Tax=Panicum hallii var. hallii TaxID=1504633 RepID=A0A2T7D4F6_9POAL|nr:hypothetical protein GQ55_6G060700 [Panicum hallii var. hallii]